MYRGEPTFNTRCGGLFSVFIILIVFGQFCLDCSTMSEDFSQTTSQTFESVVTRSTEENGWEILGPKEMVASSDPDPNKLVTIAAKLSL